MPERHILRANHFYRVNTTGARHLCNGVQGWYKGIAPTSDSLAFQLGNYQNGYCIGGYYGASTQTGVQNLVGTMVNYKNNATTTTPYATGNYTPLWIQYNGAWSPSSSNALQAECYEMIPAYRFVLPSWMDTLNITNARLQISWGGAWYSSIPSNSQGIQTTAKNTFTEQDTRFKPNTTNFTCELYGKFSTTPLPPASLISGTWDTAYNTWGWQTVNRNYDFYLSGATLDTYVRSSGATLTNFGLWSANAQAEQYLPVWSETWQTLADFSTGGYTTLIDFINTNRSFYLHFTSDQYWTPGTYAGISFFHLLRSVKLDVYLDL